MKPILYESTETQFTSNGLGRLADCISCTVTEERNGIYECQFTYPVTGEMFSEIQEGRIIAVIHDDAKDIQPFDIYAHSAPLDGVVTFYAHHISYRLGSVILKPMEASSCVSALAAIPNNTYNRCPFTFWTDKATSGKWENKVPSAVKAILGGQRGSILDVYGKGEYKWDKFLVRLYVNRGNDNGVSIRYGVNLTELQQEYDESGSYNAVAPYWVNSEDGTVVTLTKGIVSVNAGTRLVPWTTKSGEEITDRAGNPIYFEVGVPVTPVPMDLSEAFEEQPTEAQLEAEAIRRLNSSEAWLPSENITVQFINLADTEEYKNVAALQRVSLCDRVSVYCGPLNVSAVKMQVIRVVYNVLTERYDEIELGKAKVSFAQTIEAKVEEAIKDLPTASMMQKAINNATDRITGAKGGHLLDIYDADGKRQEMVIMDTEDVATAVKVWRWNLGGLGYSKNGYNGPYGLAITQDGAIVADFITVGTLIANIIKAGILSDKSGKNFWNMETGEFSLAAATTVGGLTVESIAQNKANAAASTAETNAKTYADDAVDALDESLTQQSVFNRLTNNGQTQGIFLKNGILYINASYIMSGTIDGTVVTAKLLHIINDKGDVIAKLEDTLVLGKSGNTNVIINDNSLIMRDKNDNIYFSVRDLRNEEGYVEYTETITVLPNHYPQFYPNITPYTIKSVYWDGSASIYTDYGTHIRILSTKSTTSTLTVTYRSTTPTYNMVFGDLEDSSQRGAYASSFGEHNTLKGNYSIAVGYYAAAIDHYSAVFGRNTKAGYCSLAFGHGSDASKGLYAFAGGYFCVASGMYSHAEGQETIAAGEAQHVFGYYNVSDELSIEIVGNGFGDKNRNNARTLDKHGNEWIAGTLTQASDSRLKDESGEVPDLSQIRARRFEWNDKKGAHDDLDHIGYFAQDVEKIAPYLVQEDAMGYKSLDYIALLCAKVEYLERRVEQLESEVKRNDD